MGAVIGIGIGPVPPGDALDQVPVFVGIRLRLDACGGGGFQIPLFVIPHGLGRLPHQGKIVKPRRVGVLLIGAQHLNAGNRGVCPLRHNGQRGELPPAEGRVKGRIMPLRSPVGIGKASSVLSR